MVQINNEFFLIIAFVPKTRVRHQSLTLNSFRSKPDPNFSSLQDNQHFVPEDPHSQLIDYIKSRVDSSYRPVLHAESPVNIHVKAALYQIVDLVCHPCLFLN